MEWLEITSRTVEDAKDKLLDQLGVDEVDAEFDVLEEPRPGLFGRMRGQARVRARVAPRRQRPKQDRRERRRPSTRKGRDREDAGASPGRARPADRADKADAGQDDAPTRTEEGPRRRRRGGSRPTEAAGPRAGSGASRTSTNGAGASGSEQGDKVLTTLSLDDHTAAVASFMTGLVDAFAVGGEVVVAEIDSETREVRVEGDDVGLLIGPRGLTLQAIHELARTVVYRLAPDGQDGRVRIDVGGYRERRRVALSAFAVRIAEDVRSSGRATALEPMNPPDRKVVHDVINDIDGVRTTSEGEEPRRRVVVLPDA